MPLPYRFLAGASAAAHAPQLLSSVSRRTLISGNLWNRRFGAGALGLARVLEQKRYLSEHNLGQEDAPNGRNYTSEDFRAADEDRLKVFGNDVMEHYLENGSKYWELHKKFQELVDEVTQLRYSKWLRETHNVEFTPPADNSLEALKNHLETIEQFLPEDVVKKIDYEMESVLYPLSYELGVLKRDMLSIARDMSQIAFATSNRRINHGGEPYPVLFKIAPLAGQRLKIMRGKFTLKYVYMPPTFEDLGIHRALETSACKLVKLGRKVQYARNSCGLAPPPTPLRTEGINVNYYWRGYWPQPVALRIPKIKKGTPRLWFQPVEVALDPFADSKNVVQIYESNADANLRPLKKKRDKVRITWYHKEHEGLEDTREVKTRRFSSRRAWDEGNNAAKILGYRATPPVYPKEKDPSQPLVRKVLYSPISEPRPIVTVSYNPSISATPYIVSTLYSSRISAPPPPPPPPHLVSEPNNQEKHGISEGDSSQVDAMEPKKDNEGPRIQYHASLSPLESLDGSITRKVLFNSTPRTPAPYNWRRILLESRGSVTEQSRGYSTDTASSMGLKSPLPKSQPGPYNEYLLPNTVGDGSKGIWRPVRDRESLLRSKLLRQEVDRQDLLTAVRQGKEFHVGGVEKAPDEMLEEADFVQALTELATSNVEDITETSGMEFMEIGDLIELRTFGGGSELGIFIQPPLTKNGNFLFLTESGRIKTWPTTGMVFTIPRFARMESAQLLQKYLHRLSEEDETLILDPPRHLTKPLTDKIRAFQKEALNVFSQKLPVIEKLYDMYSHETEFRLLTTHEAAKAIFPDGYENHQIYAVHLALMDNGQHFIADGGRHHKKTTQFEVRSRKQLAMIKQVTEWLRMKTVTLETGKKGKKYSDVIDLFALKAAALVDMSRGLRGNQSSLFGPVEAVPLPELAWNEDDKAIIEFLKCSMERYWFQTSPVAALYPQILKATKRYQEEWRLDVDLLYIFLMEIGVYRPWENRYRFSYRLPLPHHTLSGEADALADKVAEVDKDAEAAWNKLGLKDKMDSFREDISETIFAIDDPSAEEIDDGISFTPVSDTESWVHVHVANPTAFLEPDHWIAEMAKQKLQTLYLPEKTFGMIPRGFVDYKWGLASDRPTLTISVKLDNQTGHVIDYKIRYGNAKNVKRLTYANLNTLLGYESTKPYTLVVNPPRDPKTGEVIDHTLKNPQNTLTPEETNVLTQLRKIAIAIKKKRVAAGSLSFVNDSFRIFVNDHPLNPHASNEVNINPDFPTLYRGLPSLTFVRDQPPTPAHETVAEFMLLGGTIVSHFLSSHKIPAPYRTHNIIPRKGAREIWENILLPNRNEMGVIDKKILRDHFNVLGASRMLVNPGAHELLGINIDPNTNIGGYTKATSPLRRYLDMVVHFQLEQVVRNLRDGLPASHNIPFSESYLAQELPFAAHKERRMRDMQQASEKFWVWKLIRWGTLESKIVPGRERLMPKQYTIELTSKNHYLEPSMGMLREFGIPMKFWFNTEPSWTQAEWGSIGEAEVDESLWSRIKINMKWIRTL